MADPRTEAGARRLFNEGEKLAYGDLNDAMSVSERSFLHLVAELLRDSVNDQPQSGVFGDGFLCSQGAGVLDIDIAAGLGLYYDSTETSAFASHYKPVQREAGVTQTLDAHDGNPRYDIISIEPDTDDDESVTDAVKDPATGTVSNQSIDTRRFWYANYTVTKGTAAAHPSVPSTPSGHIKIAEIYVPATSGAVTIRDARPRLALGEKMIRGPGAGFCQDFVPGSGDELLVEADNGGMYVFIDSGNDGDGVIDGIRRHYIAREFTIAAAHATLDRIDLVSLNPDGSIDITKGTAHASPSVPATPAGNQAIASILVDAAVTTIAASKVTDLRVREPIGVDQVEDDQLTDAKMATKTAHADLTVNAESAGPPDTITIDIQMKDNDGNSISAVCRLLVEFQIAGGPEPAYTSYYLDETGAGSIVDPTNTVIFGVGVERVRMIIDTDANGQAQVTAYDVAGGGNHGVFVQFTPLERPGYPTLADCPFN